MNKNNPFFIHKSDSFDSLIKILKSGFILPSFMIHNKYSSLSGDTKFNIIFANIVFPDIKNISFLQPFSFLLSHKLTSHKFTIKEGWGYMHANSFTTDSNKNFKKHINTIKNISLGYSLPPQIRQIEHMQHEIFFYRKISINKFCFAIYCGNCSSYQLTIIKKLIRKFNYNISIILDNSIFTH
jgi:hypothetical protein